MNQEVAGLPGYSWGASQDLESDGSSMMHVFRYETPGTVYRIATVVR